MIPALNGSDSSYDQADNRRFCGSRLQKCGVPVGNVGRIVGGKDVGGYRYPWYALLHPPSRRGAIICGGTLVTENHVLTAAHCFKSLRGVPIEKQFVVALGVYNRCQIDSTSKEFTVSKVVLHPKYGQKKEYFDIAVVTLSSPASSFTSACLPAPETSNRVVMLSEPVQEPVWTYNPWDLWGMRLGRTGLSAERSQGDTDGLILGFGSTRPGDRKSVPCTMRQATIHVYSREECMKSGLPLQDKTDSTLICAGVKEGGKDTCQGDSGGGLMVVKDGRYYLLGIVSFGYGCGVRNIPGLYTRVTSYLNWINEHIKTRSAEKKPSNTATNQIIERPVNRPSFQYQRPGQASSIYFQNYPYYLNGNDLYYGPYAPGWGAWSYRH
ncbi:trypsin [Anabrus simplex]|uniref:trypsin n=1 Tax=Anabrus simplex TaxID=316456 RepID=UPI0035A2C710